jgi:hypothetical protein
VTIELDLIDIGPVFLISGALTDLAFCHRALHGTRASFSAHVEPLDTDSLEGSSVRL